MSDTNGTDAGSPGHWLPLSWLAGFGLTAEECLERGLACDGGDPWTYAATLPDLLAPAPKDGQGLHADGLRSLWAFIGKVVYAQPVQGAGDAIYLALGAKFEETTGEVYVNKIDKPLFVCRVKLLEVY